MSEFLQMGGYGFYVWGSYGMLVLCIAVELWQIRRRRAEARQRAQETAEEIFS